MNKTYNTYEELVKLLKVYMTESNLELIDSYYKEALKYVQQAPLIRLSLAQALLQNENQQNAIQAQKELEKILLTEQDIPFAWQLLATAYDRTNQIALRDYAMAELYRTQGDYKNAEKTAQKALKNLKKDTPQYYKARDILDLSPKK